MVHSFNLNMQLVFFYSIKHNFIAGISTRSKQLNYRSSRPPLEAPILVEKVPESYKTLLVNQNHNFLTYCTLPSKRVGVNVLRVNRTEL